MAELKASIASEGVISGKVSAGEMILNDYRLIIEDIEGGHRLTATRGSEVQSIDIMDGADGFAPTIDIKHNLLPDTANGWVQSFINGYDITITDKNGSETITLQDGRTGARGYAGTSSHVKLEQQDDGVQITSTVTYGGAQPTVPTVTTAFVKNGKTPVKGVDYFTKEDIEDLSAFFAFSIINEAIGEEIIINDCATAPLRGLVIYGKTTQKGIPTPDTPVELVDIGEYGTITVSIRSENADDNQSINIFVNDGMSGIPIASWRDDSNYVDIRGRKWICDKVDLGNGTHTQRVGKIVLNGTESWSKSSLDTNAPGGIYRYSLSTAVPANVVSGSGIVFDGCCTHFVPISANTGFQGGTIGVAITASGMLNFYTRDIDKATFTAWLSEQYTNGTPVTVYYVLPTPIETPIQNETLVDFSKLRTQYPVTNISNDAGAGMMVSYVADTKEYIDNGDYYDEMMSYVHIPRVIFTGSTDGMSKDNEVILNFQYQGAKHYINDPTDSGKREGSIVYGGYAKVKWQGSSSIKFPKKNYTIKLYSDKACESKMLLTLRESWGAQNKYCMKSNFIDPTHCRNIIAARLWSKVVNSRSDYDSLPEPLRLSPNNGAIDGYPVLVFINKCYVGLYTMNIPKEDWMFGMTNGEGVNTVLCGEQWSDVTKFNTAPAEDTFETDWGYEVEPQDKSWVFNSFNAIYTALAMPESTADEIAAKKAALEACLDINSVIDARIYLNKLGLTDNAGKNQIMATYDGIKWIMSMYDLDTAFGMVWSGAKYNPATIDIGGNNLHSTIFRLYSIEYAERKKAIDLLLPKAVISEELMNFAIDIPQEAFMLEAKLWPDMGGANMNGMNQIQDFFNYREADNVAINVPTPSTEDAGKFLRVDSAGAYVLEIMSNAEEVGF